MAIINAAFSRDANSVPIDHLGLIASKTIAYDGTANKGAQGTTTLFTVTGVVQIRNIFAACSEDLISAGGGTIAVGTADTADWWITATTATTIDNNEFFTDQTPSRTVVDSSQSDFMTLLNGRNIVETIGTGDITDGTLTYYCIWSPISSNGNVVAA